MKKHFYLVCYMKEIPHGFSVGNCVIELDRPIDHGDFPGINEQVTAGRETGLSANNHQHHGIANPQPITS